MTLAEVAERSGLAQETLSRLETGALTNPTLKTLSAYADAVELQLTLEADPADGVDQGPSEDSIPGSRPLSRTQQWARQIIQELQRDPEVSDRLIAERVGCSHQMVCNWREKCENQGMIPRVEQRRGRGGRVQNVSRRRDAARGEGELIGPFVEILCEEDLQRAVVAYLRGLPGGEEVKEKVSCSAGVADIVTPDAVYELKERLDRSKWFESFGQALCYRDALDALRMKRPVIVCGSFYERTHEDLEPQEIKYGLQVLVWDGQGLISTGAALQRHRHRKKAIPPTEGV